MSPETCRETVLVIGGHGFLGKAIGAELQRHGYRVLSGVRSRVPGTNDERQCDLASMTTSEHWRDALEGVDAVVNAAGILRESSVQTFDAVHARGPLALARACVDRGIRCFLQISVLGDPRDGEFVASKHRFDAALLQLPLRVVVLRPSVVYSMAGSYGGTSLLRALAALPFGVWVPGTGEWQMQPLDVRDLAEIVARAITADAAGIFEIGGPTPVSLREYLRQWRHWLHIPGERVIRVPMGLVLLQVWIAECFGRGPMSATIWRMLRRGNVTAPETPPQLEKTFGLAPRGLAEVQSTHPSQVQDRWHARLYFLAPLLCAALAILWIVSGLAGLFASAATVESLRVMWLPPPFAVALARVAGGVDLAFAVWLASGWRRRWALTGMATCVLCYTIVFSLWMPASWLAPLGGLAKNLVILPAIAVLWVLSDRR
ncbi:MAG: SDR family oxidoreductase [Xanthomonadales bacterium]|nr:SDR family oxidoreductase [Xanthomonadales bacterium]ODU94999.1 MAG: hypothetical protein ABT18_01550 [Rhodanobacter sp. SCN 66-43]OJY82255.1 MAG: hypothetical protein BGP23_01745 [Xanthomonadales bacterium 66-474]